MLSPSISTLFFCLSLTFAAPNAKAVAKAKRVDDVSNGLYVDNLIAKANSKGGFDGGITSRSASNVGNFVGQGRNSNNNFGVSSSYSRYIFCHYINGSVTVLEHKRSLKEQESLHCHSYSGMICIH